MLRIGICDDLKIDRTSLALLLDEYLSSRQLPGMITQFQDAEALLHAFVPGKFHLLFLDIYMPGLSGMELAKQIHARDSDCNILFSTTSKDYAIESYAVRAAGYLVKPYSIDELGEALDWCFDQLKDRLQAIEIISNREKMAIPLQSILYLEVRGRSSILHTTSGVYATNVRLATLEESLGTGFLRSHRSYIINMHHIAMPLKDGFMLTDGSSVPISIDNVNTVKQQYFDWKFLRTWEGGHT